MLAMTLVKQRTSKAHVLANAEEEKSPEPTEIPMDLENLLQEENNMASQQYVSGFGKSLLNTLQL